MPTVIGVDSSTQSCKVMLVDVESGQILRESALPHPEGTEVHPDAWWETLSQSLQKLDAPQASAISIGGQQHGLVALDSKGNVVRPALLWNDTRSATQAKRILEEFGRQDIASRTGSIPVASFTSTKLAWVRDNEPELAKRISAVVLPHDWLTWRLRGYGPEGSSTFGPDFDELVTDRSDASGTGYFSPETNTYDDEILNFVLGHRPVLPRVLGPSESAGTTESGMIVGPGGGDNAIAALGLGAQKNDVVISLGTSGTVFAMTSKPAQDPSGTVAGFADATGGFLPLVATLNASRAVDSVRQLLRLSWEEFSQAIDVSPPGAEGLTLAPFFDGERVPNLPDARGMMAGISRANLTPPNMARAVVEGLVSNLALGLDAIESQTEAAGRALVIGGGAQSRGVQQILAEILSLPVFVPMPGEYVALGAAKQAAWVMSGNPPVWETSGVEMPPQERNTIAREQFAGLLALYEK